MTCTKSPNVAVSPRIAGRIFFAAVSVTLGVAETALAGSQFIARIIPDHDPNRTERISGITFDGGMNPLVIDGTSWGLSRLDVNTGAVLQKTVPSPHPSGTTRSLVFDPASGLYFTEQNQKLARIDLTANFATLLAASWPAFNFQCMAINPVDGRLWLATDNSHGQLWEVDKGTGAVTLRTTFGVFQGSGGGISSLAIGPAGDFYVSGGTVGLDRDSVYRINPDSGSVTFVTSLGFTSDADFVVDFDYSPITRRWYGIEELRSTSPREYHLIEITGIPEPASTGCTLLALAAAALTRRRRDGNAGVRT